MNLLDDPVIRSITMGIIGLLVVFFICFVLLDMNFTPSAIGSLFVGVGTVYFTYPDRN